jgi:hypothetical protein
MKKAFIAAATIGTAEIADAAITSAKIAELDAGKITFNEATGEYFDAAVIKGGKIEGTTITGNTIKGGTIEGTEITGGSVIGSIVNASEFYAPKGVKQTNGTWDFTNWKFKVDANGNMFSRSGTTGARMEIANNVIKVFDTAGRIRVQIGDLSV